MFLENSPVNAALANPPPNTNLPGILVNHIVNVSFSFETLDQKNILTALIGLTHVIALQGTVLYSTTIANVTNATSAGGSHIDFINNDTGTYARSGDKTLLIVQSDIITRNGVIHLVNGLFDPSTATPTFPLPNQNNAVSFF
jgi:uncharacterized surface protein with fasciclin (FAS1) repeats